MNKEQAGRLLTLAWYLRHNVKESQFNLGSYASISKTATKKIPNYSKDAERLPVKTYDEVLERFPRCKTSACALGYATNIWPESFLLRGSVWNGVSTFCIADGSGGIVAYSGTHVCNFFGLSYNEASFLFSTFNPRTNIQEAEEIEKIVRKHGWEYAE